MNTNFLKAKSLSKEQAYVLFFIFQAPYAYVGKWKMQFLYWFRLFTGYWSASYMNFDW